MLFSQPLMLRKMLNLLKIFGKLLYKWLPTLISVVALIISLVNTHSIQVANKRVDDLTLLINEQNKSIEQHLQAIEGHLAFLDKWAHQEYIAIYGDVNNARVKVK